jgi:hypothetical protein
MKLRSSHRSSLKEFPMFSQLPSELRFLIWKTASFITRNVDITTERRGSIRRRLATGYQKLRAYKYLSRCLPPAILHTNKQSQAEGLKWYHIDFGYIIDGAGDFGYSAPPEIMSTGMQTEYVSWVLLGEDHLDLYVYRSLLPLFKTSNAVARKTECDRWLATSSLSHTRTC